MPLVWGVSSRVCGRPLQCKQEFEQLVTCGQVLSYVRPLKCGMHVPRAHMVFVDRIQIASAVCLTALRAVLVFSDPVSLTFCPYVAFRPYRTNRGHPRITPSRACPRSPVFQFQTAFLFRVAIPHQRQPLLAPGRFPS